MQEHELLAAKALEIRKRMDAACAACGRSPSTVQLCAASKTRSAATVQAAQGTAIDLFGENRVQELVQKHEAGAYGSYPLHFIGHLQTNKVRQVVGRAHVVESVDSKKLLLAIQKEAARQQLCQNILLEVNIGGEATKSGIAPQELPDLLALADAQPNLQVLGLMCIPPRCEEFQQQEVWFARMHQLFVQCQNMPLQRSRMEILSMGMSGDFEAAIRHGATIVRVGTGIFGPRAYPQPV